MLVGIGVILIIAIMGGAVAYLGDKIGTKVGKRRMSLFGLRPKYTSIIVTIVTGILIATSTLTILAVASKDVRTALFGMQQLKAEMKQLNADVAAKNKELEEGKIALDGKTKELQTIKGDVQATQEELEEARLARDTMGEDLQTTQDAFAEATQRLEASHSEIKNLEDTKQLLEGHISNLQVTTKQLEAGITNLREGTVLFRVNETLSGAVIRPGLDKVGAEAALTNIINDTNGLILRRIGETESKSVLYVSRSNVDEVASQIANSNEPMVVRVVAAGNIIFGEPALAEIKVYPYRLVYKANDVIWSTVMQAGPNAQPGLLSFLKDVNVQAKSQGIIPNTLTGDVGTVSAEELYETIHLIESMSGAVTIQAVVREDTYTSGPVNIHLQVLPTQ